MKDGKRVLMYDGTLLANMHSKKGFARTGIFFVAYNVFMQLMKCAKFSMVVYSRKPSQHLVMQTVAECNVGAVPVISDEDVDWFAPDIFLSPFHAFPAVVAENPAIVKCTILHDVTPVLQQDAEDTQLEFFAMARGLNGHDFYFANSEHTKKDFLRFYPVLDPEKVKVTYLAAADHFSQCTDTQRMARVRNKYGIPGDKPYVFSLCTLEPRKNLVHAVKCFAEFVRRHAVDDLHFVLGGGHHEAFLALLEQEIDDLGEIQKRIIRTGYVDDEDLAPLFSGALCTAYVSLYEGFGLPVLEAMQCGCPVITSSVTSMPEVIGDAGIIVDPLDPVALEKAYARYYFDADFRNACSDAGLARAKLFSWERCAEQIAQGMEQACLVPGAGSKRPHWWWRRLFGRVRTEQGMTLRFFGLPAFEKRRTPDSISLRVFGLPVIRRAYAGYEVRTYLLGVPIRTRPNYAFIDSQLDRYTKDCAAAIARLGGISQAATGVV